MRKREKAFTLAEVLITLVIIGVIAAITVPSVITNTQNEELVSKLKKTFSTMAQATDQIIMEEGLASEWATSTDDVYNLYKKHLNLLKDCGSGTGCFTQSYFIRTSGVKESEKWDEKTQFRRFILADGAQVAIHEATKECNMNNLGDDGTNNICVAIITDVNGAKGPNTYGKDVFAFNVKENGLYPAGCDIDGLCDKNHIGWACACKVLYEGKINF